MSSFHAAATILPFPNSAMRDDPWPGDLSSNEDPSPRETLLPQMKDALANAADALDDLFLAFDEGFRPYVRNKENNIKPDVRSFVEEAALKAKVLRHLLNDLKATLPPIDELFPEEK
jgi:hypothetical protein